ncbi:hypothetical protein [Sulfitobacter sp. S190]|uniref:hypothetical protein n=1 Tax=Sulfitobacter sp. S190 TaxID=2867022 RepID=UPI0021A79696|nr:hypothetical protein [Sulfitobacter sp. S190]UWR24275.1 hypothetical protein K3756_12610 [Sulfitobacter sp. S190]
MIDAPQKLEISQKEIELIEAALQTQSKILRVQASAGGSGAREKLNDVKRTLATITAQRDNQRSKSCAGTGLSGLVRFMTQAT